MSQEDFDAIYGDHTFYQDVTTCAASGPTLTGSTDMVKFMSAWAWSESSGGGGDYNPLNSVGGTGTAYNSNGGNPVKNYADLEYGVQQTVSFLNEPTWKDVLANIKSNNADGAIEAIRSVYAKWGSPQHADLIIRVLANVDIKATMPSLHGTTLEDWSNKVLSGLAATPSPDAAAPATPSTPAASSSTGCGGAGNGVVAGNIIKTAMGLAYPTPQGTNGIGSETPAYRDAYHQYTGGSNTTDCGVFVATVMIASGIDPNYPKVGTGNQSAYVQKPENADKYIIIKQPTDSSQLMPGDILIYNDGDNGHTSIYVGDQGFPGYNIIEASLNHGGDPGRTPQASNSLSWMLARPNLIAVRMK